MCVLLYPKDGTKTLVWGPTENSEKRKFSLRTSGLRYRRWQQFHNRIDIIKIRKFKSYVKKLQNR